MQVEDYQPYIDTIVQALVGLLVVFVLGVIAALRSKLEAFINARTTAAQRETLHKLAKEAMALSESAWASGNGDAKMLAAIRYVSQRAGELGIDISPETIRGAVEKAVMDYNVQVKAKTGGAQP